MGTFLKVIVFQEEMNPLHFSDRYLPLGLSRGEVSQPIFGAALQIAPVEDCKAYRQECQKIVNWQAS